MSQYCFTLCALPCSGSGIRVRGNGERIPMFHIGNGIEDLGHSVLLVCIFESQITIQ